MNNANQSAGVLPPEFCGEGTDCTGLTKREVMAMHAMQNILSRYNPYEQGDFDSSNWESTAKNSVGLADALLKELNK